MAERLAQCPYNPSHQIPENRLQFHMVRCGDRQNKKIKMARCPANSVHVMPASELNHHLQNCMDYGRFLLAEHRLPLHVPSMRNLAHNVNQAPQQVNSENLSAQMESSRKDTNEAVDTKGNLIPGKNTGTSNIASTQQKTPEPLRTSNRNVTNTDAMTVSNPSSTDATHKQVRNDSGKR